MLPLACVSKVQVHVPEDAPHVATSLPLTFSPRTRETPTQQTLTHVHRSLHTHELRGTMGILACPRNSLFICLTNRGQNSCKLKFRLN